MSNNNEIQSIIDNIKGTFTPQEKNRYDSSFNDLSEMYSLDEAVLESLDSFCLGSLNLFYSPQYGLPERIYSGVGDEKASSFMRSAYRKCKQALRAYCNAPDGNNYSLVNSSIEVILSNVISPIIDFLLASVGLPVFILSIIVSSMVSWCRIKSIESICSLFK